jgi:hypothetical protein
VHVSLREVMRDESHMKLISILKVLCISLPSNSPALRPTSYLNLNLRCLLPGSWQHAAQVSSRLFELLTANC